MAPPRRCSRCGKTFPSSKSLAQHVKEKHALYYYGVRLLPLLLLIAIIPLLAYFGIPALISSSEPDVAVDVWNLPLPVVTDQGLSSEQIALSSIGGTPILLEFMVSWCSHCQNMAPTLEELYGEYGESVMFLSVAGTWQGANANTTAEFIRTYHSSWLHVMDEKGAVFGHFGVESTPTYILFDSDGQMVERLQGELSKQELASKLASLR